MIRKRAFTLIEVMVVLSALALIAILAYSFFGGVYRDAVNTRHALAIGKDMRAISDAFAEYYRRTGVLPAVSTYAEKTAWYDELASMDILREPPWPTDTDMLHPVTACASNTSPGGAGGYYLTYTNLSGGAENDFVIKLMCVSDEICRAYNKIHGFGDGISTEHWNIENYGGKLCATVVTPDMDNQVMWLGDVDIN